MSTKPYGTKITIYEDGSVDIGGVEYGPNISVKERTSECVVLHVPGHKTWSGRGSTRYVSPKLLIYAIEGEYAVTDSRTQREVGTALRVRGLVEIPQGRGKQ